VVVAAQIVGSANLGGTTLVASGPSDLALAKYAGQTGAHLWSQRYGGLYDDRANGVAVDGTGAIVIAGFFRGTIDFGTGPLTVPFASDLDVFVAKFTATGTATWAKKFPNTGNDQAYGVAVDTTGNVAIVGTFSNSIDFGGGAMVSENALIDVFVVKLTSAGAHTWSMDGAGNVFVTGYAPATLDLGGGSLAGFGGTDGFVAKYAAAAGAHLWSRLFGGADNDHGHGVGIDANGNVAVAGRFEGTAAFGGSSLTSAGATDAFVAKYAAGGAPIWARRLGGADAEQAYDVAFTTGGNPATAGYFYASGTFGGTNLTSAGMADAFVTVLAP
jgi:hypothetical protein